LGANALEGAIFCSTFLRKVESTFLRKVDHLGPSGGKSYWMRVFWVDLWKVDHVSLQGSKLVVDLPKEGRPPGARWRQELLEQLFFG
jgi:hypothetical protein